MMTRCLCARVTYGEACCSACAEGQHTVACSLRQVAAGATVVLLPGQRWDFDLTTLPQHSAEAQA